eukprot:3938450-Rhodomonas_salina.1
MNPARPRETDTDSGTSVSPGRTPVMIIWYDSYAASQGLAQARDIPGVHGCFTPREIAGGDQISSISAIFPSCPSVFFSPALESARPAHAGSTIMPCGLHRKSRDERPVTSTDDPQLKEEDGSRYH